MTAITILFPDDLAQKAEAAGLLSSEEIVRLVQEEMQRKLIVPDAVLRRMVQEALDDPRPSIPHEEVFALLREHRERRRQA